MANWLDHYKQAKFRNVEFFVNSHDFTGGRRKTKFQYPGSDRVDFQDHGQDGKDFSIRAYLVGDDYYVRRNQLINALDKKGAGELVHPYYGKLNVQVIDYSVSEHSSEGRMVRLTITFSEASISVRTVETINTQTKVYNAREAVLIAINDFFIAAYSVVKKPFAVIDNVQQTINVGFSAVQNAKTVYQAVSEYQDRIERVIESIPTLFREIEELSQETIELIAFGTGLIGAHQATIENAREMFDDFIDLFNFEPNKIFQEENDPAEIFSQLLAYSTIAVSGSLLSVIDFTNYSDAIETRDILFKEIDRVLQIVGLDDNIFTSLLDLRTEIYNDIEARIGDLSRTSVVVLPESLPAITLSYQLYGSIENEQLIVDRNNVDNPGFLDANTPLEVETSV